MSSNIHFAYIRYLSIFIFTKISLQNHVSGLLIFGKANLRETFVTLYSGSLEICQENCVDRTKCMSLNYHTQYPFECSLNSEQVGEIEERFGWIHQARSEILIESPCSNCNRYQTCDRGTGKCIYRECEPIKTGAAFIRLGNGNILGSRAVLACPHNTYPENSNQLGVWPLTGVCQEYGQWSLLWIPTCSNYENICQSYHTGPEIKTKMTLWSNFIQRDIMLLSGPCSVDDLMMSSSSAFTDTYLAHWSKFDFEQDTWVCEAGDQNPYLRVDFDLVTEVKGIRIRGRRTTDGFDQYATLLNVTYSSDCSQDMFESYVRNETGGADFAGNVDSTSIVEHMFEPPTNALCVRVNILQYFTNYEYSPNYFGMKLDLFGTAILPVL